MQHLHRDRPGGARCGRRGRPRRSRPPPRRTSSTKRPSASARPVSEPGARRDRRAPRPPPPVVRVSAATWPRAQGRRNGRRALAIAAAAARACPRLGCSRAVSRRRLARRASRAPKSSLPERARVLLVERREPEREGARLVRRAGGLGEHHERLVEAVDVDLEHVRARVDRRGLEREVSDLAGDGDPCEVAAVASVGASRRDHREERAHELQSCGAGAPHSAEQEDHDAVDPATCRALSQSRRSDE